MSGALVVSLDTELGWGAIENGRWRDREAVGVYERTRPAVARLLRVMDELEAPATWAFVGGLLERRGQHALDHLPPPRRAAVVAALAAGRESTFAGHDLIGRVLATRVRHEIASHTYSHTRFRDTGVDATFARQDLLLARRMLAPVAGAPTTLVFPSNDEGFEREVRESGHCLVRGAPAAGRAAPRAVVLLLAVLTPPPPAVLTEDGGLRRLTGSMVFNSRDGRLDRIPFVLFRAWRGLARAVTRGGVFHVWTHPFNFGTSAPLLRAFECFLRRAAAARDRGRLRIVTMAEAAMTGSTAVRAEPAS